MWLQKQDPDRVSVVKEAMELQVEAWEATETLLYNFDYPMVSECGAIKITDDRVILQFPEKPTVYVENEEDEVAAASSSDTSVEENPEDDWFGTFTQAPVERGSRNIHKTNAVKLVGTLLAGPSKVDLGDGAFMGEKVLSKLFVKLMVVINECILRTLK